ncbi:RING finger protein [Salix suchowensis]|nr:RING finger protein [Salix suchowensis]
MRPSGYRWTLLNYWFPYHAFHALGGVIGGTPPGAEHIPCLILSSTFFDSRRWGFAVYGLVEKIALLLNSGAGPGRYFAVTSNSHDCFGILRNGSSYEAVIIAYGSFMLTGYSGGIDGKEWAGLYSAGGSGLLQSLLLTKFYIEICLEGQINGVLLPCRHGDPPFYYQCLTCCQKCKKCLLCLATIAEQLPV